MGLYERESGGASKVAIEVKLLITLWTLGNKESFRGIGDRFGMLPGVVYTKKDGNFWHTYSSFLI